MLVVGRAPHVYSLKNSRVVRFILKSVVRIIVGTIDRDKTM